MPGKVWSEKHEGCLRGWAGSGHVCHTLPAPWGVPGGPPREGANEPLEGCPRQGRGQPRTVPSVTGRFHIRHRALAFLCARSRPRNSDTRRPQSLTVNRGSLGFQRVCYSRRENARRQSDPGGPPITSPLTHQVIPPTRLSGGGCPGHWWLRGKGALAGSLQAVPPDLALSGLKLASREGVSCKRT